MSRTLKAASSISAFTLLSRVLGFVRDVIMLRLLGTGWIMDTFVVAWMFPNLLRRLLGEGALAASFIPAYAATLDRDGPKPARLLLASVSGALVMGLVAVVVIVLLVFTLMPARWLSSPGEGDNASGALLVQLTLILFPYVVFICLVAVYNGALNAHGVFAWPAALPVILNVFWITGLVVGAAWFSDSPTAIVTVTASFLLAAGVTQLAVAAWQLRRRGALPAPAPMRAGDPARGVFARMGPTIVGMSMLQLNTVLDHGFAYYLIEPGANTHVYNANRLLLFPHALTSLALATAVFPRFAVLASRDQLTELGKQIDRALSVTVFLALPASVGLILVAPDFLHVFFEAGKFDAEAVQLSAATTACLVAGLPFHGVAQLYARALYALDDMRSPARVAVVLVPTNVALNAFFVLVLDTGVPGLTLATSLCAILSALALRRILRARCPASAPAGPVMLRAALATACMAGVVVAVQATFDGTSKLEVGLLHLALPIGLGGFAYATSHALMGGEEVQQLLRRRR